MPLFYSLRPLLTPFTSTLIYPLHHLPKPKSPFIPYGFNISIQEGKEIIAHIESSQTNAPKAIIIFVGGFVIQLCELYIGNLWHLMNLFVLNSI